MPDLAEVQLTEVVDGLFRIEVPLGDRFVCVYIWRGKRATLVIDTGVASTASDSIAPGLAQLGIDPGDVRYVVNTHADVDHMGANAPVRELCPHAIFVCHRLDRRLIEDVEAMISDRYGEFADDHGIRDSDEATDWVRSSGLATPIDLEVSGGERLWLGPDLAVDLLHTPGHSRGHLTVYHAAGRTAVISDAVLWRGVQARDGSVAMPPTYRYVDSYEQTIQQLQAMPVDLLLTGHYPVYRGDEVAEFLAESENFAAELDRSLREQLQAAGAPATSRELLAAVGPGIGSWPEATGDALIYPALGHLERFAQHRLVEVGRRDGFVTWRWIGS